MRHVAQDVHKRPAAPALGADKSMHVHLLLSERKSGSAQAGRRPCRLHSQPRCGLQALQIRAKQRTVEKVEGLVLSAIRPGVRINRYPHPHREGTAGCFKVK